MIFVSAQQDSRYCLWQLAVQLSNFRELGIEQDAVCLIGYYPGGPSNEARALAAQTKATFVFIPDTREQQHYVPSIYFHLVSKWLSANRVYESCFFHDSDIIFRELPLFSKLLCDDINYFSNVSNYLSPKLYDQSVLSQAADLIGVDKSKILNTLLVGGAQYLVKDLDPQLWILAERRSVMLFDYFTSMRNVQSQRKPIDPWLAGMFALKWTMIDRDMKFELHPELNFTWPAYSASTWAHTKILHNAGITADLGNKVFRKGEFNLNSPWRDPRIAVGANTYSTEYAGWYYYQQVLRAKQMFQLSF